MKLVTLRKRREYLRLRGGARWSCPPFIMEAKPRISDKPALQSAIQDLAADESLGQEKAPRFGFTVTKRLGNAVKRNRIRRRLKAAITIQSVIGAREGFDYVVVARPQAMDMDFSKLTGHVAQAFKQIHRPQPPNRKRHRRGGKRTDASPHDVSESKRTTK